MHTSATHKLQYHSWYLLDKNGDSLYKWNLLKLLKTWQNAEQEYFALLANRKNIGFPNADGHFIGQIPFEKKSMKISRKFLVARKFLKVITYYDSLIQKKNWKFVTTDEISVAYFNQKKGLRPHQPLSQQINEL